MFVKVMACDDIESQIQKLGLSESKLKETLRNSNLSKTLSRIVDKAEEICAVDKSLGILLYSLASKSKNFSEWRMNILIEYICHGKITNEAQLNGAIEYLLSESVHKGQFDANLLDNAAGVGVIVSPSEIEKTVNDVITSKIAEVKLRNFGSFGNIIAEVKQLLKWANGKLVTEIVEKELVAILGPRSNYSNKSTILQKDALTKEATISHLSRNSDGSIRVVFDFSSLSHFHKPGENFKTDGYVIHSGTMKLLKEHLQRTGGKVITRFPPEPNGILHVGHAKSINLNFGYAREHGGITYLRFDDTNPEKEEDRFFKEIISILEWLGYKPFKITYASDYFDRMYNLARTLIRKNLAYVCHQNADELKHEMSCLSPWRNRPVAESLELFEAMRNGLFAEKTATLRMKMIMDDGKLDPVSYRIKYAHHARTGDKWCIYPTYDYTHCLNDSFEDISHSLCTKEFQNRRSSYYWLCNALDLYCPVQWEFGRLNLNYTVVSKRKIAKLIEHNIVRDWDDPRLFTLAGLRRRGFPAEAINLFCAKIGITTAQSTLHPDLLDSCAREVLNLTARRVMAVSKPLKVEICNYADFSIVKCRVADFPANADSACHYVTFTPVIFIDSSDFVETHNENYKRFSPTQPVGLRHAGFVLTWKSTVMRPDGSIANIVAKAQKVDDGDKPKAFIQWVSAVHGRPAILRLYSPLFKHENPEDKVTVPEGFLSDVNHDSLIEEQDALVDESISLDTSAFTKFQFERIGYFSVDPDSPKRPDFDRQKSFLIPSESQLVFNLTVTLKEDAVKRNG